jgi:hypothetical protein
MIHYCVELGYTSNPKKLMPKKEKGPSIDSCIVAFCLHATGVSRLFNKDSVQEFLYRVAIILRKYDVVGAFFKDDTIFSFTDGNVDYTINLNDVIDHLGIEVSNNPDEYMPREKWVTCMEKLWTNSCTISALCGMPIPDKLPDGLNSYVIGSNRPVPADDEYKKAIEIFVSSIMKSIGEEEFIKLEKRTKERRIYLEDFKRRLAIKPAYQFDWNAISFKLKMKIYDIIFGYGAVNRDWKGFQEEMNEEESTFRALVYLAWIWAHGYINTYQVQQGIRVGWMAEVDDRLDFDYSKYDGLSGLGIGVNLYSTYYEFHLDKVSPLLRVKK